MTETYATSQAMRMAPVNGFARRSTLHVCAALAGQWSPISIETTDRKPGRYRRTQVCTT